MIIKILGAGCSKCNKLQKNLEDALKALDIKARIENVGELKDIASYGVMRTPALVLDEKVISVGKVLSTKELSKILAKYD